MKALKPKQLSKEEEYERTLHVRNLINSIEKNWGNTTVSTNELKEFSKVERANLNFSNIKLIQDKELKCLFKKCLLCTRKGEIAKLIRESKFDFNVFYRTKKKLNIPNFDIAELRQNIESEIIEKYLIDDLTTIEIAELYDFTPTNINNILRKNNIKIKDRYTKRRLLKFATQSSLSQEELEKTLYKLYVIDKLSIKEIRKETNLDEGCISNKLRAMRIDIKPSRSKTKTKFVCLWCSGEGFAWTTGKRMQKYCCSSCKNKAKDLRRMKPSQKAMQNMLLQLTNTWGDKYDIILNKIMDKSANHTKIIQFSNQKVRAEL